MPIFLDAPVKVIRLKKGNIIFNGDIRTRQIQFGEGIAGFSASATQIYIEESGKLIFEGSAFIAKGCTLRVDNGGVLILGNNFGMNKKSVIRCSERVTFKEDALLGWNNEINDNDGHPIFVNGQRIESSLPILIGRHVWITSHVKISKGVEIPNDCIVAKGAVVTKRHKVPNTLIGGVPAKDIKNRIEWGIY